MRSFSGEHRVRRNVESEGTHRNPSGLATLITGEGEVIVNAVRGGSGTVAGTVEAPRPRPATIGEIRSVLVDLLTLAQNARDAAGEPFYGDRPHFAIRQAEALLPRLAL